MDCQLIKYSDTIKTNFLQININKGLEMTKIIGAGLAGLIAANTAFQDAEIYESQSRATMRRHQGVLRFRSPKIGETLGIPFKKVKVHKSIYSQDRHHSVCNVQHANEYSQKVVGKLESRSIWNLDTVDRWIAPNDFQDILIKRCENRIQFDTVQTNLNRSEILISTMPLQIMSGLAGIITPDRIDFKMQKIAAIEFIIPGADVCQTIYFPDTHGEFPDDNEPFNIYRASITGDKLIVESTCIPSRHITNEIDTVLRAFGIMSLKTQLLSNCPEWQSSRQGKISPIDDQWRKKTIFELSSNHGVYSLGRFATWRQILLDDVLQDVYRIKKFIESDNYDRRVKS